MKKWNGDLGKEAEDFFMETGMTDTIEEMSHLWVKNYTIQGEETDELEEILRRAPQRLLDQILKTWEEKLPEEAAKGIPRKEQEQTAAEVIKASLLDELPFLDKFEIELFLKLMNGHPVTEMEVAQAADFYVPKGWVFLFAEDDLANPVVPGELREKTIAALQDPKIQEAMGLILAARLSLSAAVNLYGVFSRETLKKLILEGMLEIGTDGLDEQDIQYMRKLEEVLEKIIDRLCRREDENYWCDKEWIISEDFETKQEYRRFLRQNDGKKYCILSRKEINYYAEEQVDRKNPAYKQLFSELTQLLAGRSTADNVMYELEYKVVEKDLNYAGILDTLKYYGVWFSNVAKEESFARLSNDWIYTVKKWSNRGFSDKELGKAKAEVSLAPLSSQVRQPAYKKIGRNDPCPCGSGKKYKKCCGREN